MESLSREALSSISSLATDAESEMGDSSSWTSAASSAGTFGSASGRTSAVTQGRRQASHPAAGASAPGAVVARDGGAARPLYRTEVPDDGRTPSTYSMTSDGSGYDTSHTSSFYTDGSMAVGGGRRSPAMSGCSDLRRSDLELIRAAERGDTNSVKTLLSSAQVSSVDIGLGLMSRTPLHRASGYGQVEVVEMLLAARAKVGTRDANNRTPLHEACIGGYVHCLRALLLADGTAHIDVADRGGLTVAHVAAAHGEAQCLEMVLDYGCDPCAEDTVGRTAAHHAVVHDFAPALKVLIDRGIEVDSVDHNGRAPAHYAAEAGAMACLKMLASNGVDLSSADGDGAQPCHLAASHNKLACLKFLLKSGGADLEARDNRLRTVLHMAALTGALQSVHYLLASGMSPSCLDEAGHTPLHLAASSANSQAFSCLLQHGGNLDLRDTRGNLPVHVARQSGATIPIMKAIEGRDQCPMCKDLNEKRKFAALHPPTEVQEAMSKVHQHLFHPQLDFNPPNMAVPPGVARARQTMKSKSLTRLPPLGQVQQRGGGAQRKTAAQSRARDDCEVTRGVAASMLYGRPLKR